MTVRRWKERGDQVWLFESGDLFAYVDIYPDRTSLVALGGKRLQPRVLLSAHPEYYDLLAAHFAAPAHELQRLTETHPELRA